MVGGIGLEPMTSSASRKRSSSELTTQRGVILQTVFFFVKDFRGFPGTPEGQCLHPRGRPPLLFMGRARESPGEQGSPVGVGRFRPEPCDEAHQAQVSEKIPVGHALPRSSTMECREGSAAAEARTAGSRTSPATSAPTPAI